MIRLAARAVQPLALLVAYIAGLALSLCRPGLAITAAAGLSALVLGAVAFRQRAGALIHRSLERRTRDC